MEKLLELGLDLPDEFAAFPVVLLDEVAVIWASKGGHDVLAYYIPVVRASVAGFERHRVCVQGCLPILQ